MSVSEDFSEVLWRGGEDGGVEELVHRPAEKSRVGHFGPDGNRYLLYLVLCSTQERRRSIHHLPESPVGKVFVTVYCILFLFLTLCTSFSANNSGLLRLSVRLISTSFNSDNTVNPLGDEIAHESKD